MYNLQVTLAQITIFSEKFFWCPSLYLCSCENNKRPPDLTLILSSNSKKMLTQLNDTQESAPRQGTQLEGFELTELFP